MTAVALHFEMRTLQDKIRLPVVVELPLQPIDRVMAQGTVLRETVRVRIAFAMAFGTFRGRVAENM